MKALVYVKRVWVPLEEQFKYLSDESSSEDEEWTEGPIKKNDRVTASKGSCFVLFLIAECILFACLMTDRNIQLHNGHWY